MDKIEKIKNELKRLKEETIIGLSEHENGVEQGRMEIINAMSLFLDTMQEEPVTSIWHDSNKEQPKAGHSVAIWNGVDGTILNNCIKVNPNRKWAYMDDLLYKYKEPVSEELEEASLEYFKQALKDGDKTKLDAFKAGAKWQKQQFEKNRLEHCDSITNEQAELEQGFIDQHLDKYQRMPTYLDAIEYGMKWQKEQMMAKAIDATIEEPEPLLWRVLGELEGLFVVENNLHDGDGVKVIIVKED